MIDALCWQASTWSAYCFCSDKPHGAKTFVEPRWTWYQYQRTDDTVEMEATRLLAHRAADEFDETGAAVEAAAHAKKFATRAAVSGLNACMQAMGADGLKQEHPLARHMAAAKIAEYLDGTTEIQNVVISRALRKAYPRVRAGS